MRTSHLVLSLLSVVGLAACAQPFNGPQDAPLMDERAIYPITVSPHMETMHVAFSGGEAGLSREMDGQLAAFTKDYMDHGNGAISVSVPQGDEDARRFFAERLSQLGVPAWRILIGSGATNSADVEVSYIRYAAQTPPCGDWSANAGDTTSNLPMPNMGCATQHNIAAMVADPRDFVSPHSTDPADAARRMQVVDKYRKGEPTAAQKTTDQSGAVSDVNKQ